MKPYQPPSASFLPMSELTMVLLTVGLGSAVIGVVAYVLSIYLWLIILFPLAVGALGGTLVKWQVKGAKLGNPTIAAFIGLFAGMLIYSIFFASDYVYFRLETEKQLATDAAYFRVSPSELLDELLLYETGSGGFLGFMKIVEREGIEISQVTDPSDRGLVITGIWVYVYYLIEAGLIVGVSTGLALDAGRQPYCPQCRNWIEKHINVGHVSTQQGSEFRSALRLGNASTIKEYIQEELFPQPPYMDVILGQCENSTSCDGMLTIRQIRKGRRGSSAIKILDRYTVTPREADFIANIPSSQLDWEPGRTNKPNFFVDFRDQGKENEEG
jgi:hypothetical protein